jgi:hypothetical protein
VTLIFVIPAGTVQDVEDCCASILLKPPLDAGTLPFIETLPEVAVMAFV